ncbi:MAG: hypothetical protein JNK37_20655, partial [Verrucomicrobiales bacterium]|nr:hypothetical protein [Verrucomicrobiales bacterium]
MKIRLVLLSLISLAAIGFVAILKMAPPAVHEVSATQPAPTATAPLPATSGESQKLAAKTTVTAPQTSTPEKSTSMRPALPAGAPLNHRGSRFQIGTANDLDTLFQKAAGDEVTLNLPGDISLTGRLRNKSVGEISSAIGIDIPGGEAHLMREGAGLFSGYLLWTGDRIAQRIEAESPGRIRLTEVEAKDIACSSWLPGSGLRGGIPLPRDIDPDAPAPAAAVGNGPAEIPPSLDSLPSATAVVYLDFDGQTVTGTPWNTAYTSGAPIVAAPSTLSDDTIIGVWERVTEDFAPFNISVTNIESRYLNAPQNRRIRIIVTPSYEWFGPDAGGVAFLGSFRDNGDNPAWVFESRLGYTEKNVAEATSHEAGHTFDLRHDGLDVGDEEYYFGHGVGSTSWAPIMGVGYGRTIVQWSKGDYFDSNNTEDDLALIGSTSNGFSHRVDDRSDTVAAAVNMATNPQTGAVSVAGILERTGDQDVFRIRSGFGQINLDISMTGPPGQTDSPSPNVDIRAELLDSTGAVIQTSDPVGTASANLTRSVTGGTFFLRLIGSSFGTPTINPPSGYTNFGVIGQYWISGIVPPAPGPPDLLPISDTGFSNTDNLTNAASLQFTGEAIAGGGSVSLYSNINGLLATGPTDANGIWTITASGLNEGVHNFTVRQGTSPDSEPLVVTIDYTPPPSPNAPDLLAGSDSGISNTDNLTNVTTPSFTITSQAGNRLELLADSTVVASLISTGTNTLASTALTDGVRNITARCVDPAGNIGNPSSVLPVTIDTLPASYPLNMRITAATDTGSSNADNITNNTSPVVQGSSEANSKVFLFVNGTAAGTHPTGGSWTLPLTNLPHGIHSITARGEDAAGNLGILSPVPLSLNVDTAAPAAPTAIRLTAATDTGVSNADNLTRLTNPSVTGNAENGATVTVFRNGTSIGNTTSNGTWTLATSGLTEGVFGFSARQTDLAGNLGPTSLSTDVTVDLTPPGPSSAPVLAPASDSGSFNNDRITRFQSLTFSGTSEPGGRVTLLANGTAVGSINSPGAWSLTSSPLLAGTHQITARAEDAAGNTAAQDSTATEVTIIVSATPPTNFRLDPSSDLGFSNTDGITSDTTPLMAGDSSVGSTIQLSIGDGASETNLGSGPGGPGWTVQSGLLPAGDGIKVIKARTLDIAGNLSSPVTTSIEIRTSNPAAPIGLNIKASSDTGVSTSDKITSDNTPNFIGLINLGGRPSLRVRLEAGGQIIGQTTVTSGSFDFATPTLPDGTYEVRARTEDFAGNLSNFSSSITVVIDTTAPAAPGAIRVAPEDDTGASNADNITRVRRPRITGLAEPGPVVLFINGTQQPGSLTSDGTWSFTPATDLPEGVTQFKARQSDLAGNQGPDSNVLAVTIDASTPAGPITAPKLHPGSDLGPLGNDRVTSDKTPTLFGTTAPGEAAAIEIDGVVVGVAAADGTGAWTFDSPELLDGNRSILVRRSDIAGNAGTASPPMLVTIDTVAPDVSINRHPSQSDPGVGDPLRFTATFTKPVFGFTGAAVSIGGPAGTGAAAAVTGAAGSTTYTIEVSGTTGEGLVEIEIPTGPATDLAGNPNTPGNGPGNTVLKKELPGPVSGVTATQDAFPDKVVVSWSALAGATGYRIFRHPFASPGAAEEIGQVGASETTFDDTTVIPGLWHSYWVRAEDEDGVGSFGTPASGRAQASANENRLANPMAEAAAAGVAITPWDNGAAGIFEGLLRDASDGRTLVGIVQTMLVSPPRAGSGLGGAVSATLLMDGRVAALRGVFDATGHLVADLPQRDGSRVIADLQLMQPTGGGEESIAGTITWQGLTALVDLPRSPYNARTNPVPAAKAGTHTLVMPALPGWGTDEPGGDGWALVNIATSGIVTV